MAKTPKMGQRVCPRCREIIQVDASVCKHCGAEFTPEEVKAAKAANGKNTRQAAIGCLALVFALGTCTYIVGRGEPDDAETGSVSTPLEERTAGASPVALTDLQQSVVSTTRLAIMRTVDCRSSAELAQDKINKAAAGQIAPVDAYEEAKRGGKACADAQEELARTDLLDNLLAKDRAIQREALAACKEAASDREDAMKRAMKIIDGDSSMESASAYRERSRHALNEETICRMKLLGLAENVGIPRSEVEFAEIKAQPPS